MVFRWLENRLVFHPTSAKEHWEPAPVSEMEDLWLRLPDGMTIHAWYLPYPHSTDAILFFHGNAGNLSHRGAMMLRLREHLRSSVLIVDYPGYGKSEGKPSEAGCYAAADAAWNWLRTVRRIEPRRITLFGESLGGGVAVDVASRNAHRALLLVKTFTALPAAGKTHYRWLPVNALMSNRFDSLSKLHLCWAPVFIASATEDQVVPFDHGKQLYSIAHPPKQFLPLTGQDHNDRLPDVFWEELTRFMQAYAA